MPEKNKSNAYGGDKSFVLKLTNDEAYILKSLLHGDKDNRKELFDFFARGKTTIVPKDVMLYLLAYLIKYNSNDKIDVNISTYDTSDEKAEDSEYCLLVSAKKINI